MATPPFSSKIIADTGISYGDEGKGRLIYEAISELQETTGQEDPLAVVLKVNGGANSGHTAGGLSDIQGFTVQILHGDNGKLGSGFNFYGAHF